MQKKNLNIKLINIRNREQFLRLDDFAEKHWGEHSHDGDPAIDFFDTPKWAVVAKLGNKTVAELFLFPREIVFGKEMLKFAGIGGVVTHTEYRHQGIATKILDQALNFCRDQKYDFCLLCTDVERLGELYMEVGFEKLKKPYYFRNKYGKTTEETGGMIADLQNPLLVKKIQDSDESLNVGLSNF